MFWARLQKLRILLCHDNPIGRVETIHSLNACGNLQCLTLFDSPLSLKVSNIASCYLSRITQDKTFLKKNYRHHVVNTVWSLKALDHHVISDEEIIEDAVFKSTRFSALQKQFEVDICPNYPKVKVITHNIVYYSSVTPCSRVLASVKRWLQ